MLSLRRDLRLPQIRYLLGRDANSTLQRLINRLDKEGLLSSGDPNDPQIRALERRLRRKAVQILAKELHSNHLDPSSISGRPYVPEDITIDGRTLLLRELYEQYRSKGYDKNRALKAVAGMLNANLVERNGRSFTASDVERVVGSKRQKRITRSIKNGKYQRPASDTPARTIIGAKEGASGNPQKPASVNEIPDSSERRRKQAQAFVTIPFDGTRYKLSKEQVLGINYALAINKIYAARRESDPPGSPKTTSLNFITGIVLNECPPALFYSLLSLIRPEQIKMTYGQFAQEIINQQAKAADGGEDSELVRLRKISQSMTILMNSLISERSAQSRSQAPFYQRSEKIETLMRAFVSTLNEDVLLGIFERLKNYFTKSGSIRKDLIQRQLNDQIDNKTKLFISQLIDIVSATDSFVDSRAIRKKKELRDIIMVQLETNISRNQDDRDILDTFKYLLGI